MTSSLHIIYKTGKFTVPVVASNSMLEVLKKGCQHFKIDDSYHQLMYGNININLSLPFRLAGIPNLSRVTITEKKGTTISNVRIAIQMIDGKRYQSNFKTNSTLWDILLHFQSAEKLSIIDKFNQDNQYIEPIVNILNREITTIELLQKSSLASLNVSESSLIKLTFKQTDRPKDEILPIIESYQPPTPPTTTSPTTTTTSSPTAKQNTLLSPTNSDTSAKSSNSNINQSSPSSTSSIKSSENTTPSMEIENNNSNQQLSPLTINNNNNNNNISPKPTTTATTTTTNNSNKKSPEPPKIITMDPKDRDLKAYLPTLVHINPSSISHNEKFTDEDFKRLVEANKRIKKEKDEFDSVLRTKAMREREEYKKLKNFQTTIIRIVLPGSSQRSLEMKFLIREKLSNLIAYLNTLLSEPNESLFLYTTPPYKVLDNNISFLKEGLYPRAKVFLGVQNGANVSFNEEVQKLFDDSLKAPSTTTATTTTTTTTTTDSNQEDTEMNNIEDGDGINNSGLDNEQERERELELERERERERDKSKLNQNQIKAPSWFLKGKK